jgi:hypothetical protein
MFLLLDTSGDVLLACVLLASLLILETALKIILSLLLPLLTPMCVPGETGGVRRDDVHCEVLEDEAYDEPCDENDLLWWLLLLLVWLVMLVMLVLLALVLLMCKGGVPKGLGGAVLFFDEYCDDAGLETQFVVVAVVVAVVAATAVAFVPSLALLTTNG